MKWLAEGEGFEPPKACAREISSLNEDFTEKYQDDLRHTEDNGKDDSEECD